MMVSIEVAHGNAAPDCFLDLGCPLRQYGSAQRFVDVKAPNFFAAKGAVRFQDRPKTRMGRKRKSLREIQMNAEGDTGEIADSKYRILECRTVDEKTCRSHSTFRYQIEDGRIGFFVSAEIVSVQYDFYGVPSFACSSTHRSNLFHTGWNFARGDFEKYIRDPPGGFPVPEWRDDRGDLHEVRPRAGDHGDGEMFHPFIPLEIRGHGTTATSPRRSRMFNSGFFPAITSS